MRTVSVIVDGFDFLPVFLITYMVGGMRSMLTWYKYVV